MALDYPALKVVKLEQNYPAEQPRAARGQALIAHNPHEHPKQLWSAQADGERIRVWECRDSAHEAEKVAAEIHFLHTARGVAWNEFCVLFRGNHQSRALEKALQLLRVPYHLSGGTAFLDRGEVKDALSWLRLLANPDDDTAFLRAVQSPKREVGGPLAKLAELAQHGGLPLSRRRKRWGCSSTAATRGVRVERIHRAARGLRSARSGWRRPTWCGNSTERSGLLAHCVRNARAISCSRSSRQSR